MTTRDRTIVLVLACIAALGGFWFVALKPKRAEATALGAQIATQQERVRTAEQTVAAGLQAKADYPRDYATVVELGKAVPADDDLPSLLFQLDSAAGSAKVDFRSLVRAAGSSDAAGDAPSASGSEPSSQSVAASLPPGATVGAAGLVTLPFTFTFSGSFFDLQNLVGDVQRFVRSGDRSISVHGRLLTVDGISLVPAQEDLSEIQAKVVATAYLSPATQDPAKAASGSTGSAPPAAPPQTSSAISGGTQ